MRTVRCSGRRGEGVCLPHPHPVHTGMHTPLPIACWDTHPQPAQCMLGYTPPPSIPWTEFLTHAWENITFPQLRLRTVEKELTTQLVWISFIIRKIRNRARSTQSSRIRKKWSFICSYLLLIMRCFIWPRNGLSVWWLGNRWLIALKYLLLGCIINCVFFVTLLGSNAAFITSHSECSTYSSVLQNHNFSKSLTIYLVCAGEKISGRRVPAHMHTRMHTLVEIS